MTVPVDPGTSLQDLVDTILLAGATGLHARFSPLYTIVSGGLSSDNMNLTAVFPWTGAHSWTQDMTLAATKKLYLDGGVDTYIYESSANVMALVTGGVTSFWITSTAIYIPAASKLYLDGGVDTYIQESAANIMSFVAGGVTSLEVRSNYVHINNVIFVIDAGQKLYLDGGVDTYIYESSANEISFVTGATTAFSIVSAGIASNGYIILPAAAKLYLDGGGDTYIYESSANVVDEYVGGTLTLRKSTTQGRYFQNFSVEATNALALNAGITTYFQELGGSYIRTIIAGSQASDLTPTAGLLLPNIDPPFANYLNRNSGVKAWANVSTTTPSFNDSYNCSSVTKLATGTYRVNWNTAFANANYSKTASVNFDSSCFASCASATTSKTDVYIRNDAGTVIDVGFSIIACGDQ